jgi:hypothetical protein
MQEEMKTPLILRRPFLSTTNAPEEWKRLEKSDSADLKF